MAVVSRLESVTHGVTSTILILTLQSLSVYHISQKYENHCKVWKMCIFKTHHWLSARKCQPNQGENVIAQIKVATKPIDQTNGKCENV